MAEKVYFKMELEGVTRERAKTVGMDYDAILTGCGLSSSVWNSARKLYRSNAVTEDYDQTAPVDAMKVDNYNRLCLGFMVDPNAYKCEPPKRVYANATPKAPTTGTPYSDMSDLSLAIESLNAKLDTTNKILGEIRNVITNPTFARSNDAISLMDKMLAKLKEIESSVGGIPTIAKDVNFTKKATSSIDQRVSGINQVCASGRIDISKIKAMAERWTSGK